MIHSHTQFCDGHATMQEMAEAAFLAGIKTYGFSPHSPLPIPSPCNMREEDVPVFLTEADRLREMYDGRMRILKGMEIDFLSSSWGPHISYFSDLPLDYRIGSVHFVPAQSGEPIDCDGSAARFRNYLRDYFHSDLNYVVDKFFSQVKEMIALGGFDVLGHFDKIAANASSVNPLIENSDSYLRHIEEVVGMAVDKNITIEINTKAFYKRHRFFPALRWWEILLNSNADIIINSDAHDPQLVTAGIREASLLLGKLSAFRHTE
ncbi:MAG: histidinol-phosphatase [Muribaculaceae bacterium]|nr:histidinol-phosphatase [Muribaculaceae bacterium]